MRTINYKVSYEKLISRLPAMFAFLEIDGNGVSEIVKATRGKEGNYGKIVANINYYNGNFEWDCQDGTHLQISNGEHSYRTLIDTYYKAIRDKEWERGSDGLYKEPFLRFMERGIGLKYVGLSEEFNGKISCGIGQKDKFPLAPDYIYLGEAKNLYNRVIKLKKQLEFYEKHTKLCGDDMKNYRAIKDEFEAHNGEKLLKVLCELIKEAEGIALEYLGYAKDTNLTLDFNINLTNTIKDLGLVTPYIQEWTPGKRYYDGDVVYHTDDNGYGMTWKCNLNGKESKYKTDELGRKYTEGYFDAETELIYFEDGNKFSYSSVEFEIPKNWEAQYLNWIDKNQEKKYWDEKKEQTNGMLKIEGEANSHLTSLRRFETYMNKDESVETPTDFKDWLWYYRKGHIANREEKYDELGNLAVMRDTNSDLYYDTIEPIIDGYKDENNIEFNGDTATNLAVCGDVITNITAENNKPYDNVGTITFTYVLGAHLTAEKGYSYMVIDEFDDKESGTTIPVNGEIDNVEYNNLPTEKQSSFDVRYYVSKDGKEEIIDAHTYNLSNNKDNYEPKYYEHREKEGAKGVDIPAHYDYGDFVTKDVYDRHKENCIFNEWYSKDDDGNYKYYFKDFKYDANSKQGVKYTESYIYYKGNVQIEVLEYFEDSQIAEIKKDQWVTEGTYNTLRGKYQNTSVEGAGTKSEWPQHFQKENGKIKTRYQNDSDVFDSDGNIKYAKGTLLTESEYNPLSNNDKAYFVKVYQSAMEFHPLDDYYKGKIIDYNTWNKLKEYNKKKCRFIEESIWTLKSQQNYNGWVDKFEAYINGVFDKGYKPKTVKMEDKNAPYYYLLYDKMEFDTSNNVHVYDLKFGGNNIKTPYIKTQFETTVDIKHVDFEDTPLIRYDYYNGVNFQPKVNDDVNIERGLTQAFERNIKFGEIKTLEDMENFANGGFFTLSKEDIDLG